MEEKTIQFETLTLPFRIEGGEWQLSLAKSQTRVKDIRQLSLLSEASDLFVPVKVTEEEDQLHFSFAAGKDAKKWEDVQALGRNDKLRLLCNIAKLKEYLSTRTTFFLHPDNLVFDDNLLPAVIYRGIRDLLPPYDIDEQQFLKQYKCLIIAMFSQKYTYDDLYSGSLEDVQETAFQRQVSETEDLTQLIRFLEDSYRQEQKTTEANMQYVPTRRFRLFKYLAISMIALSVLLAAPLIYFGFVKLPFEDKLLTAHQEFLASDYGEVIATLDGIEPEKLPSAAKYILASAYIKTESLSDEEIGVIMKNVSLKSDKDYLLYWIYNGRGEFEESIDTAKYIDDPRLIMHGLIKKIEQAKNNPDLSGTEREEEVKELQDELQQYREEYDLLPEEEDEDGATEETSEKEAESKEKEDDKKEEKEKKDSKKKKEK